MRRLALIATCTALAAMTGRARATEVFDAFQQLCMATRANNVQVLAAADKTGWMPIPQPMMDSLPKSNQIENPQGRMRSNNSRLMIMFAGRGKISPSDDLHGDVCAIMTIPPETTLDREVANFAAVPKNDQIAPGKTVYLWREENGAHVPVGGKESDIKTQFETGAVNIVMEQSMEKMSVAMLLVGSK